MSESQLSQLGCGASAPEVTVTRSHCEAVSAVAKRVGLAPDARCSSPSSATGSCEFQEVV